MTSYQQQLDAVMAQLSTDYKRLNKSQQAQAIKTIHSVRLDINDLLNDYSGKDGVIKRTRLTQLLREFDTIEKMIRANGTAVMSEIITTTSDTTVKGINAGFLSVLGMTAVSKSSISLLNENVFEAVIKRYEKDGLILSDRIWRLAGTERDRLTTVIRSGIIQGKSVSELVADVRRVQDAGTYAIKRMVVTEGQTARRTATSHVASRSDLIRGLKLHHGWHNTKICVDLSKADDYDMGVGVYPPDAYEIYNPHPHCTSYLTYVLKRGDNDDYE